MLPPKAKRRTTEEKMKAQIKTTLLIILCIAALAFTASCSAKESPYEINNEENYTVSVKYDANGGYFTTNTYVIVDSYNVDEAPKDGGMAQIALRAPDVANKNFTLARPDYFFAGWYEECIESTDENGNATVSYKGKWDFENDRLSVDPEKEYSSETPVKTLYAAWVPLYKVTFHNADNGEVLSEVKFNPNEGNTFTLPTWNDEKGSVDLNDFPERQGYTFDGAYLDADMQVSIDTAEVIHPGIMDEETATAVDTNLDIYINWKEGDWYKISTAEQFAESASVNGCYEILADLDFTDVNWPTSFVYGNFQGTIIGNGHSFKNISVTHDNANKSNIGLFGNITETASITDLTFESVSLTLEKGSTKADVNIGLFAGSISDKATLTNVVLKNSTLAISSDAYFQNPDSTFFGMVCALGNPTAIATENISATAVGENPEKVIITVNGNDLKVEFAD